MKLKSFKIKFWGKHYTVTPYLVEQVFGDGQKYLQVFPILLRPNFYVVRVDSNWSNDDADNESDIRDNIDGIWEAIEEEFGYCCENHGRCDCIGFRVWPECTSYEGCCWNVLNERDLRKLGITPDNQAA